MTPTLRSNGHPSPFNEGTHDAGVARLPAPIPFDPAAAGTPELPSFDPFAIELAGMPPRIVQLARIIRPLCVGALMAIPTVGAATIGLVAAVDADRGMAMATASVHFLAGLPTDIVVLIGVLSSGYGLAKTVEKLRGAKGL